MNTNQRILVISALCVIAAALSFTMLEWGDGWAALTKVVVFYETKAAGYQHVYNRWGLYTRHGVPGILFGVAVPLCLVAVAAYIALGKRPSNSN